MEVRLIIVSNDSGIREEVIFTEEFDRNVSEFCPPDCEVRFDKVIDADIPDTFPLEHTLRKV